MLASIQPRASPFKFARSPRTDPPGIDDAEIRVRDVREAVLTKREQDRRGVGHRNDRGDRRFTHRHVPRELGRGPQPADDRWDGAEESLIQALEALATALQRAALALGQN